VCPASANETSYPIRKSLSIAPGHAREAFDFRHRPHNRPHMGRCATKRKS
jgi:hypothetical protein